MLKKYKQKEQISDEENERREKAIKRLKLPTIIGYSGFFEDKMNVVLRFERGLKPLSNLFEEDDISTREIFKYFTQTIETLIEMNRRGVMMRDLKLQNIEVNREKGEMMFIDIDGLYPIGPQFPVIFSQDYTPPELENKGPFVETRASEQVYQMGIILEILLGYRVDSIANEYLDDWRILASDMTKSHPRLRITLETALIRVKELIDFGLVDESNHIDNRDFGARIIPMRRTSRTVENEEKTEVDNNHDTEVRGHRFSQVG